MASLSRARRAAALALTAMLAGALMAATPAAAQPSAVRPTIVLVHGAWADTSSWDGEVSALRQQGYDARAIANPLENLTTDSESVASFLRSLSGPIVLVGHSYGGAVITNAADGNPWGCRRSRRSSGGVPARPIVCVTCVTGRPPSAAGADEIEPGWRPCSP